MIRYADLTPFGRTVVAILATIALIAIMGVAGAIEGAPAKATATDGQCDALYHAVWLVQEEPSHSTLIRLAESLDCPFFEG